jgi:LysM repeat protein
MFDDHGMIRRYTDMIAKNLSVIVRNFYRSSIRTIKRNALVAVVCISLFCALSLSIGIITTKAAAKNNELRTKQVFSMEIQKGDTLWSIAKEHITDEYDDINEYIHEIKTSNGLVSDTIHEGAYLIIPYYNSITD